MQAINFVKDCSPCITPRRQRPKRKPIKPLKQRTVADEQPPKN